MLAIDAERKSPSERALYAVQSQTLFNQFRELLYEHMKLLLLVEYFALQRLMPALFTFDIGSFEEK